MYKKSVTIVYAERAGCAEARRKSGLSMQEQHLLGMKNAGPFKLNKLEKVSENQGCHKYA